MQQLHVAAATTLLSRKRHTTLSPLRVVVRPKKSCIVIPRSGHPPVLFRPRSSFRSLESSGLLAMGPELEQELDQPSPPAKILQPGGIKWRSGVLPVLRQPLSPPRARMTDQLTIKDQPRSLPSFLGQHGGDATLQKYFAAAELPLLPYPMLDSSVASSHIFAQYEKGVRLLREKAYAEAVQLWRSAYLPRKYNVTFACNLAVAMHLLSGQAKDDGYRILEQQALLHPGDPLVLYNKVTMECQLGFYAKSIQTAEQLRRLAQAFPAAWSSVNPEDLSRAEAIASAGNGDWKRALGTFRKAFPEESSTARDGPTKKPIPKRRSTRGSVPPREKIDWGNIFTALPLSSTRKLPEDTPSLPTSEQKWPAVVRPELPVQTYCIDCENLTG